MTCLSISPAEVQRIHRHLAVCRPEIFPKPQPKPKATYDTNLFCHAPLPPTARRINKSINDRLDRYIRAEKLRQAEELRKTQPCPTLTAFEECLRVASQPKPVPQPTLGWDDLPDDIQEVILKKKFHLELKEGLKAKEEASPKSYSFTPEEEVNGTALRERVRREKEFKRLFPKWGSSKISIKPRPMNLKEDWVCPIPKESTMTWTTHWEAYKVVRDTPKCWFLKHPQDPHRNETRVLKSKKKLVPVMNRPLIGIYY
jgi:hypothetical protein